MNNPVLLIVILIISAMFLTVAEVFIPSFGIIAAAAAIALAGAVVIGFSISPLAGTLVLLGVVLLFPVYVLLLVRLIPKSPLARRIFLKKAQHGGDTAEQEARALLVGRIGLTETPLRASGAIRIDGRRYYAMAESGHIAAGRKVRVLRFDGMDLIVAPVEDAPSGEAAAPETGQ